MEGFLEEGMTHFHGVNPFFVCRKVVVILK